MYGHEDGRPQILGQRLNDGFQSFHTSSGATDGNDLSFGHVAKISEDSRICEGSVRLASGFLAGKETRLGRTTRSRLANLRA